MPIGRFIPSSEPKKNRELEISLRSFPVSHYFSHRMASRRVSSRFQPPQEDDEEEEEENESDTYSEDDTSSSDADTEPEVAVNLPQRLRQLRDSAIEVDEETEDEEEANEEGSEGEEEEEFKGRVKNGEEKGKGDIEIESGDNLVLPTCPVCMEPWTSEGPHRVCCIPCGHVYGRLCLEKWLRKCGNKGKCPQCNGKFNPKQIINLYAPRIVVPNDDLEKEVKSLREKNESLTLEKARLLEEMSKQRELLEEQTSKRQKIRQTSLLEFSDQRQKLSIGALSGSNTAFPGRIVLQNELPFDGARVMVIDASNQTLMVSSKAHGIPCEHVLNKVSLLCPGEIEKIKLPNNTKIVKDLCILPNGLVALASLGRKLAVFRLLLDFIFVCNLIQNFPLLAPAWSCSGNDGNAHYIYAGLQNGKLLVFDVRQTAQPVQSLDGLTTQPIHTVHSLNNDGASRVLTASSLGPCVWDIDPGAERPTLVPGLESNGICISLACGGDNIVASFRPRVDLCQPDTLSSQTLNSPSALTNLGKLGSHVLMKKNPDGMSFCKDQVCQGNVSELRMSKSAIICLDRNDPLFAYGDEMLRGVRIWGLPSFTRYADLNPHREPVLDLRYAMGPSGLGVLGCLSEEKLQVFSCL
ncbi:E3 ubiquitin-protein ligase RFWD3-like isoform X1 [Carex littledalei]|uniref:RING-type E3 ubiquitin transferase n=1 Tax=Carex littledalei TaxID=544730 RepID=A0A833QER9_9POAL|nr:E3 ubiquitin-protein ligase RFWD3-like isoform X1 [Carex littledalei]